MNAADPRSKASFACLAALIATMHIIGPGAAPLTLSVYLCCLLLAVAFGLIQVIHIALLCTLMYSPALLPALQDTIGILPVAPLLIPLLLSTAIISVQRSTRETLSWVRPGSVSGSSWVLVVLVGIVSAGSLVVWARWTDNLGFAVQIASELDGVSLPILMFLGVPLFAVFNAATEEAIFRGVLQTALTESSVRATTAIWLQSAAFAALHYEMGFPNGLTGYAMVFLYGLVLGFLRMRTNGLLAPIAAHIIADLVIGYTVVSLVGD